MSLFGLVVFMYIMVYLCLLCYCSVLLYHMTYLQILAIKSLTGAYDRHSFGSLVSSDIILRGVLLSFFSIFWFRIGDNAKFKCGEGVNFVNFVCPHIYKKNQKIRKIIQKYLYFVYILVNKPVGCVLESFGLDKNSTSKIFLKKETGKRDKQRKTYMIVFTLLPIPSVTWAYLSLLLYICSFRI